MQIRATLLILILITLTGCSDVIPQVNLLRGEAQVPSVGSTTHSTLQTELASVGSSTSQDGYQLKAVVSKEDKASTLTSASGYSLTFDSSRD